MTYTYQPSYGFGSTLSCDPTGGTSFAVLGALVDSWDDSDAKATEIDTTLLSQKYMTSVPGQVSTGDCSFTIAYDPTSGSSAAILGALLTSGTIANWQQTYNRAGSGVPMPFLGYVSSLGVSSKKGTLVTQKVTIKKSQATGFIGV
jgi:hypothetical protein